MIPGGLLQAQRDQSQLQTEAVPTLREAVAAYERGDYTAAIKIADKVLAVDPADESAAQLRAAAHDQRGSDHFVHGRIGESLADFDAFLEFYPARKPYHWRRGISLYYDGNYAEGKKQFEIHQTVNSQDVENAVWHFLCAARAPGAGIKAARRDFIAIQGDARVPMKEVHSLYAGKGTAQAVLDAAQSVSPGEQRDNALCYAHLYLGLYYEITGDPEKSLAHIRKAAVDHAQPHYMGAVAKVHLQLRSASPESDR